MKCHYCESETNELIPYVLKSPKPGGPERIYVCKANVLRAQYKSITLPTKCQGWAKADGYEREVP